MIEAGRVLLESLWPAVALAAALGLPFGAAGRRREIMGFWGRVGVLLAVAALVGALGVAASGRVSGRAGLRLELGLAVMLAYLAGCALGALGRAAWDRVGRRDEPAA